MTKQCLKLKKNRRLNKTIRETRKFIDTTNDFATGMAKPKDPGSPGSDHTEDSDEETRLGISEYNKASGEKHISYDYNVKIIKCLEEEKKILKMLLDAQKAGREIPAVA